MLRVFRVTADLNEYQSISYSEPGWGLENIFDGTKKSDTWDPPEFYAPYPKKKKGDFWGFPLLSVFAVKEDVTSKIGKFLDQSCELLPLHFEPPKLWLCNVTFVLNCLDKKKSVHKPGIPDWFDKYVFHPGRFEFSLFKIPETGMKEILCVEGLAAPTDEFKGAVEALGLKGLKFKEIWNDQE